MIILRSKAQLDSFMERHPFRVEYDEGGYSYHEGMEYYRESSEYGVSTVVRPTRRGASRVVEVFQEEYYTYNEHDEIEERHYREVKTKTVAIYRPRK